MIEKNARICIFGVTGMVGSAVRRHLTMQGHRNIIYSLHRSLDLTNQKKVSTFFQDYKLDYVFMCAGRVGGLFANKTNPVEFFQQNMQMTMNVIDNCYKYKVKLINLGSSCMYPSNCEQPMKEENILSGTLESSSEAYSLAKSAGVKLCEYYNNQYGTKFISAIPCSLYGIKDNFNLKECHLIPAVIRKIHHAKVNDIDSVELFGSGNPLREFLYIDDVADALYFLVNNYEQGTINIGSGDEYTIANIVDIIKQLLDYEGEIIFNTSYPDGVYRKFLDSSKINDLGWRRKTMIDDGIWKTINYYLNIYDGEESMK